MTSEPLRIVLVGCGAMAHGWVDAIVKIPDVRLAGLVDLHRPAAEAMAAKAGLAASVVFESLTGAIKAVRPHVVFDVTVPSAHEPVTLEALAAGCHVLGEKPMSDTLAKAQRMVRAAADANRLYAVIQNRRYDPNIRALVRFLRAGTIGRIEELHCDFFTGPRFGGFREQMDDPLLVDMAIHTFDAARFISGADAGNVYCHSFNPKRSWYRGDASLAAIFDMSDDIVFNYRGSWCEKGRRTSWNGVWRIIGSEGTVEWDGETAFHAEVNLPVEGEPRGRNEQRPVAIEPLPHLAHEALIREFLHCVRSGETPETICTDNVRSFAMVIAAAKSARSRQRETVRWVEEETK